MATRKKTRAKEAQLGPEALSIEGGLLSPEWLSRVALLQAGAQSEADYRIHKGLNLRDEVGRYWRIAQAHWQDFAAGRSAPVEPPGLVERFILALLRDSFGFGSLAPVQTVVLDERSYPIGHAALSGRVPVVLAEKSGAIDAPTPTLGDGGRRRSAFGLAQEYLNAQEGALWGLASDGLTLRILRDNASLTRPAWIEADLQRIFTEERYPDFTALFLLLHETRFGRPDQPVTECALETWRAAGREEGTRAREHLRRGVEEALVALGQGFLSHPENHALRADLQGGALPLRDYQSQLLRLVYRLIFLLTVEERGLLHPEGTSDAVRALYAQGYSLRRLRERSVKRSAHDRFPDLWEAAKIVFCGVAGGEPRLGLPALAGLFAKSQCPALERAKLENRALLLAVFKLAWLRDANSLLRVNWRDMGPEELGSVYESLLELVPQITKDGRQFSFAAGGETRGNARKTTGSYYTPDSLVQVLLDSALDPVIADTLAKNPQKPVEALLGLSIVDPACGSGHFLLAAARRLASHVARLQANGTPSAAEYRHALRQVVGRCIYGVDLNPMAVELCKVSLWMEAVEPGLPLTFLNSHIQHGNALLGTTPELMEKGIPDSAWDPIEGDDKKTASALKKRNKKAAEGQRSLDTLWSTPNNTEAQTVARAVADLETASDADSESLAKKESKWDGILGSSEYRHQKFIADAWCAAFVWPKQAGDLADAAPTNELWRQLRDGQGRTPLLTTKTVEELAERYRFFHWHLQFPQVFGKGGFDVVLGNPPWERLQFEERAFFASRQYEIYSEENQANRRKMIARLAETEPTLYAEWSIAGRLIAGQTEFARQSGRFPLSSVGKFNSYALFAELGSNVVASNGRCGAILPTGIATDDTTKEWFSRVLRDHRVVSLFDFENRGGLFPGVHRSYRFCVLTITGVTGRVGSVAAAFFAQDPAEISARRFHLDLQAIEALNPNTLTSPMFPSEREFRITLQCHRRFPVLVREKPPNNPWGVAVERYINVSDYSREIIDRDAFSLGVPPSAFDNSTEYVPLLEGKTLHQFDHRFATYRTSDEVVRVEDRSPSYLVSYGRFLSRATALARNPALKSSSALLGLRDIARATDERTVIAAILPTGITDYTVRVVRQNEPNTSRLLLLVAQVNSLIFDFLVRQKVSGTHMTNSVLYQVAAPSPAEVEQLCYKGFVEAAAFELTYTSWDLEPFAKDVGYEGPPFRWDPERRFLLCAELDAAFFHLYGLSREDTDYVMDTFPIVRKNDEKAHGEYRTKRLILEIYDAMSEAARTGTSYRTRLDPPPADPRVAHPDTRGGKP